MALAILSCRMGAGVRARGRGGRRGEGDAGWRGRGFGVLPGPPPAPVMRQPFVTGSDRPRDLLPGLLLLGTGAGREERSREARGIWGGGTCSSRGFTHRLRMNFRHPQSWVVQTPRPPRDLLPLGW